MRVRAVSQMDHQVGVCDFFQSALEGLDHLNGQVGYEADGVQEAQLGAAAQGYPNSTQLYVLEVVCRVWNSRSLLSTSFRLIRAFMKADLPTFVYPTSATTGYICPLRYCLSCAIFLSRPSSSISLLISASRSLSLLRSTSSCDSP